ncbi:MAG: 3-deoxy-D-manno-octulosonic acid transferase [Planctomycetota bacterium]|nr:3-deoxy-D-manno-octulosonic acid transferase [Planctomycetota bacterium]
MSLILNVVWFLLLAAVSPVLLYRSLTQGKYRDGWGQKLCGNLPDCGAAPTGHQRYWFHAVSVGEVLLLQSILPELQSRSPDAEIILTTTTSTGHAVARAKFPNIIVCYFPLDFSWAVRRALARIQPTQIVLVELELWPNFLRAAQQNGIPVSLINGRLSEKSFRGYSRARWLLRPLLQSFELLAIQNETYAQRFLALGAPAERVHVTGSAKFDRVTTERRNGQTLRLRENFGLTDDEPVFIAGSTQDPEEQIALETWLELRREFPSLRLILVPRHKERFDETARLVASYGQSLLRRSAGVSGCSAPGKGDSPVILLDTLGELSSCWGLADFAFVGGSMGSRGGQNMIEPCAYGAAVCFGPHTRNFRDVVDSLLARNAARVVQDGPELSALIRHWLTDHESASRQGIAAREFVLSQAGASALTIDLLLGSEQPLSAAVAA